MKVIFVCTANVCRSPLAEGYLKALLKEKGLDGLEVSSAGVAALIGAPAFECAVDVARRFRFDISAHRAQQLTPAMIDEAERILCMEAWQASAVIEINPKRIDRVALLGSYHPKKQLLLPIPDPRDFSVQETIPVFDLIRTSVEGYLEDIASRLASANK